MPAPRLLEDVARAFKAGDISAPSTRIFTTRATEVASTSPESTGSLLSAQWTNPSDVLSVLSIIGGDIVQKALAETSGGLFTPVCFSFGWVAYSFAALVNIIGDGRLLPEPDYPVKVFNLGNGYVRDNRHWVIGRIGRDNETSMTKAHPLEGGALRISIFEAGKCNSSAAVSGSGRVRVWSIVTMLLQFGIAAIPVGVWGDWGVMMITGAGTLGALVAGALPQWKAEKLPSKRDSKKNFAISAGNGSRDIMIILGRGNCLDLEELAASESPRSTRIWEKIDFLSNQVYNEDGSEKLHGNKMKVRTTKMLFGIPLGFLMTGALCTIQCIFWIALLITVAGLKSHSWFILAVGALGMFQNAAVAAISRDPSKRNLPLIEVDVIICRTVMDGLMDLEVTFPGQGLNILGEFFPGKLRDDEIEWWEGKRDRYDDKRHREHARRGIPRSSLPKYQNSNNLRHDDDHREEDHEIVIPPLEPVISTSLLHPATRLGTESTLVGVATPLTLSTTVGPEEKITPAPKPSGSTNPAEKSHTPTASPISGSPEKATFNTIPTPVSLKEMPEILAPISESPVKPPSPRKPKGPVHFAESTKTRDFAPKRPTRSMSQPEVKSPMHEGKEHRGSVSLSVDEIYKIVQSPDWS